MALNELSLACGEKLEGSPLASLWTVHETDLENESKIQGVLRPWKEYVQPLYAWLPTEISGVVFYEVGLSLAPGSRGYDERFDQIQVMQYRSMGWLTVIPHPQILLIASASFCTCPAAAGASPISCGVLTSDECSLQVPSLLRFSFFLDHIATILRTISAIKKNNSVSLSTATTQCLL